MFPTAPASSSASNKKSSLIQELVICQKIKFQVEKLLLFFQ